MLPALLIVVPSCLVGVALYAAMSRWEIPFSQPPTGPGKRAGPARRVPLPSFRDTMFDWPVPQLSRLHPGALAAISTLSALWIVGWVVLLLVGLSKLYS